MEKLIKKKSCSNKYVTAFYYIDKVLIALSVASGGVSIISFTSIIGARVGIVIVQVLL